MKAQPKISVITIVRNDVSHIEETILSVLNQTYTEIEYIVIDGASTDGTWQSIQKYKDCLSYCISEPDNGIYDAMNKGIKAMTGEWCIFMNCGDMFYADDVISRMFSDYEDKGESLIYGDTELVNGDEKRIVKARAQASKKKECMPSFHQAIFVRSDEMKNHPFDLRYKIIADYVFFYELYGRNNNYKYFPTVVANYEYVGMTSQHKDVVIKEKCLFYLRHFDIRFFPYLLKVIKYNFLKK